MQFDSHRPLQTFSKQIGYRIDGNGVLQRWYSAARSRLFSSTTASWPLAIAGLSWYNCY